MREMRSTENKPLFLLSPHCGKYAATRCFHKMGKRRRGDGGGHAIRRLAAIPVLALLFGQCHPLPDIIKIGEGGSRSSSPSSCHVRWIYFRGKFHAPCNSYFLGEATFLLFRRAVYANLPWGSKASKAKGEGGAEEDWRRERCKAHEAAGTLSDSQHCCLRNGSSSSQ